MNASPRRPTALLASVLALACTLAVDLNADGWQTGTIYQTLLSIGHQDGNPCDVTLYDPEIFLAPNGDLRILAQGGNLFLQPDRTGNPNHCASNGIDSLFALHRDGTTGPWTAPGELECPAMTGDYVIDEGPSCRYAPPSYSPPDLMPAKYPPALASPSVVQVGGRYYMAFVGMGRDYGRGDIRWAASDDGVRWTVFSGPVPGPSIPIVKPKYTPAVNAYNQGSLCDKYGIGQVMLAYEAGQFYLHWTYFHSTTNDGNQYLEMMAWRLGYSASDPFGFAVQPSQGTQAGQIFINGSGWVPHSGELVFTYDSGPVVPGDPRLTYFNSISNSPTPMGFGAGDLKYDPSHSSWLHIYSFGGATYTQTAASLNAQSWTTPLKVNLVTLNSRYPAYDSNNYCPGIWYGTMGSRTGMWMVVPVNYAGCAMPFAGLGLAIADLDPARPSPRVVGFRPAIPPSMGGGTSFTTSLEVSDPAPAGGLDISLTSSSSAASVPGSVHVAENATTSLSVNVTTSVVTTATPVLLTASYQSSSTTAGFTVTPPVYEGYLDGANCNAIWGWAWDQNRPNTPINVDLYDGSSYLTTVSANAFRQDLLNAGKGNGYHAFIYSVPPGFGIGQTRIITARFGGTGTALANTPLAFTCSPAALTFTDDPLVAGRTTVKAIHITELRQDVDTLRARVGLGGVAWRDNPPQAGATAIKAIHIQDLRTYLDDVLTRLGYGTSPYTDPGLTAGYVIKKVHIDELRQRIKNVP